MNRFPSPLTDELLSAYLDGELTPEEHQRVIDQLEQDDRARAVVEDFKSLRAKLKALPRHTLPSAFSKRVIEACRQQEQQRDQVVSATRSGAALPVRSNARWLTTGIVGSAAMLLIAGLIAFGEFPMIGSKARDVSLVVPSLVPSESEARSSDTTELEMLSEASTDQPIEQQPVLEAPAAFAFDLDPAAPAASRAMLRSREALPVPPEALNRDAAQSDATTVFEADNRLAESAPESTARPNDDALAANSPALAESNRSKLERWDASFWAESNRGVESSKLTILVVEVRENDRSEFHRRFFTTPATESGLPQLRAKEVTSRDKARELNETSVASLPVAPQPVTRFAVGADDTRGLAAVARQPLEKTQAIVWEGPMGELAAELTALSQAAINVRELHDDVLLAEVGTRLHGGAATGPGGLSKNELASPTGTDGLDSSKESIAQPPRAQDNAVRDKQDAFSPDIAASAGDRPLNQESPRARVLIFLVSSPLPSEPNGTPETQIADPVNSSQPGANK